METLLIQKYVLPNLKESSFRSCDFHLSDEKIEDNIDVTTSSIPVTLKDRKEEKSSPYLILFYFNNESYILDEWEKLTLGDTDPELKLDSSISVGEEPLPRLKFRSVNLDYEKKLYTTFKTLTISNPFRWCKLFNEKKYFILFYLNTFPVEFYEEDLKLSSIREKFYKDSKDNYYARYLNFENDLGNQYIEKKKEEKYKVFNSIKLKGKYFRALENDKPFQGIKKGKLYRMVERSPGFFFPEEIN